LNKKKKWQLPKSTLRERLQQRASKREDSLWSEPDPESKRLSLENLPAQFIRTMNEHLFQKSVAAILVVICLGLFSLLNLPLTNRLVDAVHYLTVHQVSPTELVESARPVMQTVRDFNWRRHSETAEPNPVNRVSETMAVPVNGVLVSPYGIRTHPYEDRIEMHYGIDVAADSGSPVYAAFSGRVSLVQEHPVYGITVYVEHDEDMVTIYGRIAEPQVSSGEQVIRGQMLGVIAPVSQGDSHLHFEVWKEGQPVDPQEFLDEP
jgi:murein DD-endopeptidase MepM/ murein hydrolase activator NlpD